METRGSQRVVLGRQVRFCVSADEPPEPQGARINNHAGFPRPGGLSPHYQVTIELFGVPDPDTSCLGNIKAIDRIVREAFVPIIIRCVAEGLAWPGQWLTAGWPAVRQALAEAHRPDADINLSAMVLDWTPFHRLTFRGEAKMVYLTEQFEFSAAHRLWSDRLTDDDNYRTFGKCANPASHGHNYVLDVTVATEGPTDLGDIEQVVNQSVIAELDHRNLNVDCPEFVSVNPTVENICAFIWQRLSAGPLSQVLHSVRLYETAKTYAECRR